MSHIHASDRREYVNRYSDGRDLGCALQVRRLMLFEPPVCGRKAEEHI
jgi:hypothetical protein